MAAHILHGKLALMLFGDGLGQGEADAKAAAAGPGPVGAVKAVKEPVKLQKPHGMISVVDDKDGMLSRLEAHGNGPAGIAVFDRIVHKDRDQLADGALVSRDGHAGGDGCV